MFEQDSGTPTPQTTEVGTGDAEARRKRRRRRGKKKSDGNTTAEKHSTVQQDKASGAEPPPKPAIQARDTEPTLASADTPKGTADHRSRQSRRKNQKRRHDASVPEDSVGEPTNTQSKADSQTDKSLPLGKPVGKHGRRERQEREPQGSVLQRRLSREAKAREESSEDDFQPAATPVNVNTVEAYISQLRGWQREVVTKLRSIVRSQAPDAKESIMWSQPVYTVNGPVVYIKAFSDHVNLGFWRGNEIDDPAGRLIGELPTMRHITIRHVNEVDRELFEAYVRAAVKLDRDKGDATA